MVQYMAPILNTLTERLWRSGCASAISPECYRVGVPVISALIGATTLPHCPF